MRIPVRTVIILGGNFSLGSPESFQLALLGDLTSEGQFTFALRATFKTILEIRNTQRICVFL